VVAAAIVLGACEPPVTPAPPRCDAPPPTLEPFVVDWPAADLDRFVALAKQGTVVVHADGCSLRPLPECHTMGHYAFQALPASTDTELVDDDLHQLAPGAADRLAAIGREGRVRVERSFGGAWVTSHGATSAAQLVGSCDGATHVVSQAFVGAFVLASGNKQLVSKGWPQSCAAGAGAGAQAPPAGCDSWIKVQLGAIAPMPAAGETCTAPRQGCADPRTALLCVSGRLADVPCRGKAGCSIAESGPTCDRDLAATGDPCTGETFACSPDGLDMLACRAGAFDVSQHCRGPRHCARQGSTIECDTTEAQVGDACDTSSRGGFACTSDHAAMLRCDAGRFVVDSSCRGTKGCALDATTFRVACDTTRARAGDPCNHADAIACSEDGAAQLACRGGSFTKQRDCPKPCTVTDGTLHCG
jgi:hypothetical protein